MSAPRMIMRRYGGSAQLRINNFSELMQALDLPDVHWAVLSCPCKGMDCDDRFLDLIDADDDQRISVLDLRKAIKWTSERLVNETDFTTKSAEIKLERFNELAEPLKKTALTILNNLGVEDKSIITLDQVRKRDEILKHSGKNGDGIISIDCLDEGQIKTDLSDIAKCVVCIDDRSGKPGIGREQLNTFKTQRDLALNMINERQQHLSWGDDSVSIAKTIMTVDEEVRAWFRLAELHAVNPELANAFIKKQGQAGDARNAEAINSAMAAQLLAEVPSSELAWDQIRPSDSGKQLRRLRELCFPETSHLTIDMWQSAHQDAQKILQWLEKFEANPCSKLSQARLKELNDQCIAEIEALCDKDAELSEDIKHVDDLERLLLCKRWLLPFANNFVSLPYLFEHDKRAMFEQGSLLIAGRMFHLAVSVDNHAEHLKLATESGMCICYLQVSGDKPRREFEVAVPVTAGTRAGLFVGRRGVFRDINNIILEAKIVHIIDNPVSIKEAIFQPFTRIGKFISGKIEDWSSSADKKFEKQVGDVLSDKPVEAPAKTDTAQTNFGSTLMGGSVAFAALGSSLAFITKQLSELQIHKILLGLSIIIALIMIPTAIVAFLKIRRRNLSALLQASQWAINDRMLLGYKLSKLFSNKPALPDQAISEKRDQLERILKNVVLEDDNFEAVRPWAVLSTLAAVACVSAQTIYCLFQAIPPIGLLVVTPVCALLALILGYRTWPKHWLRLLLLIALLASSITAVALPFL